MARGCRYSIMSLWLIDGLTCNYRNACQFKVWFTLQDIHTGMGASIFFFNSIATGWAGGSIIEARVHELLRGGEAKYFNYYKWSLISQVGGTMWGHFCHPFLYVGAFLLHFSTYGGPFHHVREGLSILLFSMWEVFFALMGGGGGLSLVSAHAHYIYFNTVIC